MQISLKTNIVVFFLNFLREIATALFRPHKNIIAGILLQDSGYLYFLMKQPI